MVPLALQWLWLVAVMGSSEFPNPQKEWRLCGRHKASYVCDPDFILERGDVERLDQLSHEFLRSTSCLCSQCSTGVSVGIFVKHNLTQQTIQQYKSGKAIAEMLRKRWNLGKCDDDIVIILLTELNISDFSMGSTVQTLFPEETAIQIMRDCRFHFESGWFYQGLESIINSFNDVLIQLQKKKKKINEGLIIGISLGAGVFLILIISAIVLLYRQIKLRKQYCENVYEGISSKNNRKMFSLEKEHAHQLQKLNQAANSDDDDDDDNAEFGKITCQNDKLHIPSMEFFQKKRQLSDVLEESSDDNDITDDTTLSFKELQYLPNQNKNNMQITEL